MCVHSFLKTSPPPPPGTIPHPVPFSLPPQTEQDSEARGVDSNHSPLTNSLFVYFMYAVLFDLHGDR